jgi:hypothetical protein
LKKIFIILFGILTAAAFSQPQFSQINSMPGSFSRIGFGARGMGMGNAMSSVTDGNLVSYYNPAVTVFQNDNSFQTSYSFLSLDRALNFLNFTRRFDFYSAADSVNENRKPRSSAGISLGIINSGVSKIDGRDNQGLPTGELSTSENQFFIGLANRFSAKLSIGIAIKFYYYKLYEEITTTGLGVDLGVLYKVNENWNAAITITDINSKYKWDTNSLYGQSGASTEDKFPNLIKFGVSYTDLTKGLILSGEFQIATRSDSVEEKEHLSIHSRTRPGETPSNVQSRVIRFGAEYNIVDRLFIRGGIDGLDISNSDNLPKPAAGFSYSKKFGNMIIGVDYAFMMEQYSPQDRHVVGLNIIF